MDNSTSVQGHKRIFSQPSTTKEAISNSTIAPPSIRIQENVLMTADERVLRECWAGFQAWCKKRLSAKKLAVAPSPSVASSSGERMVSESAVLEAYAKGYQDGWNAGLPNRQDSAAPSHGESASMAPKSAKESRRSSSLTSGQIEQRGFQSGWKKAWDVVKKDGWTQGCFNCSQHVRHSNVLRRTSGVTVRGESFDIPNKSSRRTYHKPQKAWSTTAVRGYRRSGQRDSVGTVDGRIR